MQLTLVLKLFHILAAFWLVTGLLGRIFAFQRARHAQALPNVASLVQLFSFFSTKMVSPGGILVFVLGLLTAWAGGWPILGFLQGGHTNWVLASLVLMVFVYVSVATLALPNGKMLGKAMGGAMQSGTITPELTAVLNSSRFTAMFVIENTLVVLLVILMVLKPF